MLIMKQILYFQYARSFT